MISESTFTTAQVIRDIKTLMSGIDRTASDLDEYLFLSLRNILLWLPAEHTSDK